MPYRISLFFGLILGFLAPSVPYARCQEFERPNLEAKDLEAALRTDWYGLYLNGKKIGYFRTARERQGNSVRDIESFNMKLFSFGKKTEILINQVTTFEGAAPFRMVRAEMDQRSDPTPPEKILVVRNDKGFAYTHQAGKESVTKQIGDIDYTLADALAQDVWIRRAPAGGDQARFRQFDAKDAKVHTLSSKLLGIKTSLVGGVSVRYYEVENHSSKEMLTFLTRHDEEGRTLSSVVAIFELRLETEEQATNTEYSQDLFVLGMVKSDRPLGPTKSVTELVIQVDGKESEIFEDGPRQSVVPGPGGGKRVQLGKRYGKETPATKQEIEECLEETNAYPISHPKIKALAKQAVGDAQTAGEKVKRIVNFVNSYIHPSLAATMPAIHDLLEKKQGDCKSYALLVTNLARASGIPTREVSGLLYVGDDQKTFGGHAWNEVVLDGRWVPIDATLRQTEVDATHISFGAENKAAKNLLTTLGKLSFKVVEVKSGK